MRKAIVMLAVVVGLAGLQMNAEARGGKGGGGNGSGGGMGSVSQGGGEGMKQAGDMNRYQHRERVKVQDGSQVDSGTKAQQRQRLRDPDLHVTPTDATPTE